MKRLSLLVLVFTLLLSTQVQAKTAEDYKTPTKIRCTCYCEGKVTASGDAVREGIVAGRRDWIGKTAVIYDMDMNLIGVYEFKDTGSAKSLRNGTSIDVYRTSLDRCYDWVRTYGDYVYLEIIDAEG